MWGRGGSTEWESSHDGVRLLVLGEEFWVPRSISYVKLECGCCLLLLEDVCLLHDHMLVCKGHLGVWIEVRLLLGDCKGGVLLEKGIEAGIKWCCIWGGCPWCWLRHKWLLDLRLPMRGLLGLRGGGV